MRARLSMVAVVLGLFALGACDGGETATGTGGTGGEGATGGAGGPAGGGGQGGGTTGPNGGGGQGGNTTTSIGGGGSGGTGGSGGSGGDDLSALSDDFEDPSTLSNWTFLHEVLGQEPPYDYLDIDTTAPGKLVFEPTVSAWYQDQMALFMYKEVTGDFRVEIEVAAYQKGTASSPPTEAFNSVGMLVRDPASVVGDQSWLMYNIGYQGAPLNAIGVEGKATVGSQSELPLIGTNGVHTGRLRMCRLGNTVRMLCRLTGATEWTETHVFPGSFPNTPAYTLPQTVQVGIIDNAYVVAGLRAEVESIEFARVDEPSDCTAD